ncbi:MAG: hypothetical protein JWN62_299 [Acidimicrobiales bacterium]|nr:hypothetical protein [Acidimicrobiales bacterium]
MSWRDRAKTVAASLKAEYEAGKQGDESPAAPIWATPKQQLDGLVSLFRANQGGAGVADGAGEDGAGAAGVDRAEGGPDVDQTPATEAADAAAVADVMRNVDWAGVRAATADRTAEATKAMKAMADHVDWGKVQPVAAQVSSALIAAIATGQLGVGGRLATTVARAMTDQGGLGQKVAAELDDAPAGVPTDFGPTIVAASREV